MIEKLFIYKDNKAIIICPKCEKSKAVDVSGYMRTNEAVNLTHECACGYLYNVLLERRNRFRKTIDIPATYTHFVAGQQLAKGSMTVKEITRAGLKLKLYEDEKEKFHVDDRLLVEFHLDDKPRSLIRKEAIIRNLHGFYVGAEFPYVDLYDKAIGFYMFK